MAALSTNLIPARGLKHSKLNWDAPGAEGLSTNLIPARGLKLIPAKFINKNQICFPLT